MVFDDGKSSLSRCYIASVFEITLFSDASQGLIDDWERVSSRPSNEKIWGGGVIRMRETKNYCDHCGRNLNEKIDYVATRIPWPFTVYYVETDLCKQCMENLRKTVFNFVNMSEDGRHRDEKKISNN